jgi:putative Mn2+ efflux pump MntP
VISLAGAIKVAVIAVSLALDVFAVSVGVGVRGVAPSLKWRIGIAFATAEVVMNVVGALLGAVAGRLLGEFAGYLGFAALFAVGCYMIVEAVRDAEKRSLNLASGWGLFLASLSISLDSLGIGFSILYIGVPVWFSLAAVAAMSVLATALGLALGKRLGSLIEDRAELIGGVLLALTGAVFILLKALHAG